MLRKVFTFPVCLVLVAVLFLVASNPGVSQPVSAASNQQALFRIPHQMVPNDWYYIPSGLGPGDSFRLLFVTHGSIAGTSNNITRYNTFVRNEALANEYSKDRRHLANTFTALVSVFEGLDARGNTFTRHPGVGNDPGHDSPIYWQGKGGKKVADNYADFYDGSWDSREARKADGGWWLVEYQEVFTGSTHQGTHAIHDNGWNLGLGSPPAWWNLGQVTTAVGSISTKHHDIPGWEIFVRAWKGKNELPLYGISPLLKVRETTGVKPVISGPTGLMRGPFDVTISFPDDYLIQGMALSDITVSGGKASNLRHTAGAGVSGQEAGGTKYTVTITPSYSSSIYEPKTVSVSMGAGAVTDINDWASVASDTFSAKSIYLQKTAVNIPFDSDGVGTVPQSWYYIPSTDLKPGDSFRLLFVTSDKRDGRPTNIDDYNRFVQNAAARNTLLNNFSGRFRVLGSTQTVHAIDNSGTRGTGVPIYWLDGSRAARDYPDFYDGSWESRTGVDEQGRGMAYGAKVWTGTNDDGTRASSHLGVGRFGWAYSVYSALGRAQPFATASTDAEDPEHFYSLSPVLKVAKTGGL